MNVFDRYFVASMTYCWVFASECGAGLVNHCVLAGNAYQKAVEIALEITKQVHNSADNMHD